MLKAGGHPTQPPGLPVTCDDGTLARPADPHQRSLTVLGAHDVAAAVHGHERELIAVVESVLMAHGRGQTRVPPAQLLQIPGRDTTRLVARGAGMGGAQPLAGVHWQASFPDNAALGLPRQAGLIVLNRPDSGRPATVVEGSLIGGQRTAAVAALAARTLHARQRVGTLGIFGCGLAGREIARFVLADERPVDAVLLWDANRDYSRSLADALRGNARVAAVSVCRSRKEMIASCDLLAFATSAARPSLDSIERSPRDATILHVSLRALTANALLQGDNLADDADGLLVSANAVQRAVQLTGRRDIVRATLGQVLLGQAPAREAGRPVIFHSAGLAVLDLAIARFVAERCTDSGAGVVVPGFLA